MPEPASCTKASTRTIQRSSHANGSRGPTLCSANSFSRSTKPTRSFSKKHDQKRTGGFAFTNPPLHFVWSKVLLQTNRRLQWQIVRRSTYHDGVLAWQQRPVVFLFVEDRQILRIHLNRHAALFARIQLDFRESDQTLW